MEKFLFGGLLLYEDVSVMCFFQFNQRLTDLKLWLTVDPKIVLITRSYHGFVVDVDSGRIVRKLKGALPKISKNYVSVTKRNGKCLKH